MSSAALSNLASTQPLPPVAAEVDTSLAAIDAELDWLLALTPLGTDALWEAFEAADRTRVPALRYAEPVLDLETMRKRLGELPVEKIESPLLAGVLREKQRELERMIELVRLRGTDGFVTASIDLFGGVEAGLLELAEQILADVGPSERLTADCGVDAVVAAVEDEVAWYRERAPDFALEITVDADVGSLMMVSHGRLYLDADLRLPGARVQPLVQHEIGTHIVTRYNGLRQPMRQLAVGLANYDPLQEGLGVLAEYLAGYLPGERLRVLAARVVAADLAIHGEDIPVIFARLHDTHGFATDDAFDIAVRALRGGGLTKDAVYLRGLCDLLDHLRAGGEFESLFRGKFALSHLVVLDQLAEAGWAEPPALLPRYASADGFEQILDRCRNIPVQRLFQSHPTPPRELCA
ncbi:flavohemoglobin expression-modulating QEGLA motif protein [Luteimonas sp. A277]